MPQLSSKHPDPEIRERSNQLLKSAGYTTDNGVDDDASRPIGMDSNTKKAMSYLGSFFLLIAFAWLLISAFNAIETSERTVFEQRASQVDGLIPGLIAQLEVKQESFDSKGLPPTLVWKGKDATILGTTSSASNRLSFGKSWTTIAKTQNGRYFTVTHSLSMGCDKADWKTHCLIRTGFQGLTVDQAKRMIFDSGDAVLFEKIFGEKMPPKEVAA